MFSPAGWLLPAKHPLSHEHNSSATCNPNQGRLFVFSSAVCVGLHVDVIVIVECSMGKAYVYGFELMFLHEVCHIRLFDCFYKFEIILTF